MTLDGKVAFVTGAARGQGQSHAIRLAQEGADIIAVDICEDIASVPYPLAREEELKETVARIEAMGRRVVARKADVRDRAGLGQAVEAGVAELGRLDIVVANAGIAPLSKDPSDPEEPWNDVIAVNLTGVFNTIQASVPSILAGGAGGSVILTTSTAGLKGNLAFGTIGGYGYGAAKHGVIGLMRIFAYELAAQSIRVNAVAPTGVRTVMGTDDSIVSLFADDPTLAVSAANLMPVDMVEPSDVSEAVAWLASDAARYVTGLVLPVDAGYNTK